MLNSLFSPFQSPRSRGSDRISTETALDDGFHWVTLERHTLEEAMRFFKERGRRNPAFEKLLSLYKPERKFPDLGNFRLGPNMFDKTPVDWILLVAEDGGDGRPALAGHGLTTRLSWSGGPETLPDGWQGAVRRSYEDTVYEPRPCNSLVGLFIFVERDFRQKNWAAQFIAKMKSLAARRDLEHLIIPLRPPERYEKEFAEMPFSEFAALKRPDGLPKDHWVRLHVRLGAQILGISETSHQHALPLRDFQTLIDPTPFERSGYRLVQQDDGWYNAYVDIEHGFALINQGCVWVRHAPGLETGSG